MNPVVAGANGVVVITQVIPSSGQHVMQAGPNIPQNTIGQVPVALQKFFKGEPKALGVAQILIGVMQIILAIIVVSVNATIVSISAIICIPFWAGVFFIISGSLSVAAQNKANMCLVKGSMVTNIISSIAAVIGVILFSLQLSCTYRVYYSISNYSYHILEIALHGLEGVLLLLMFLEFCISISTFVFGCKAEYYMSNSNKQSVTILQNESKPEMNFNLVAPPMHYVDNQNRPEASLPSEPAPTYNEINENRPEANFSAMETPEYIDTEPYKPQVNLYTLVLPTTDNNSKTGPLIDKNVEGTLTSDQARDYF